MPGSAGSSRSTFLSPHEEAKETPVVLATKPEMKPLAQAATLPLPLPPYVTCPGLAMQLLWGCHDHSRPL